MEVVRNSENDFYYKIVNKYGEVPKELLGLYTSQDVAKKAIVAFQSGVRAKVNKPKERIRAADNSTTTS